MNKEDRKQLRADIGRVQKKIVAAAENIVDIIGSAPPSQQRPAIETVRRHTSRLLETWRICNRSACRRARCCRGEPMHCLRMAVPVLPPDFFAGLVGKRRRSRRARSLPQNPC